MSAAPKRSWTGALRERVVAGLPPEKLLPDSQPAYMTSWIYVFGVLTPASLVVIIASGSILTLKGPGWGGRARPPRHAAIPITRTSA
jgi:ubiquinol-cytochrome c reductase cytochrome b subunit